MSDAQGQHRRGHSEFILLQYTDTAAVAKPLSLAVAQNRAWCNASACCLEHVVVLLRAPRLNNSSSRTAPPPPYWAKVQLVLRMLLTRNRTVVYLDLDAFFLRPWCPDFSAAAAAAAKARRHHAPPGAHPQRADPFGALAGMSSVRGTSAHLNGSNSSNGTTPGTSVGVGAGRASGVSMIISADPPMHLTRVPPDWQHGFPFEWWLARHRMRHGHRATLSPPSNRTHRASRRFPVAKFCAGFFAVAADPAGVEIMAAWWRLYRTRIKVAWTATGRCAACRRIFAHGQHTPMRWHGATAPPKTPAKAYADTDTHNSTSSACVDSRCVYGKFADQGAFASFVLPKFASAVAVHGPGFQDASARCTFGVVKHLLGAAKWALPLLIDACAQRPHAAAAQLRSDSTLRRLLREATGLATLSPTVFINLEDDSTEWVIPAHAESPTTAGSKL